MKENKEVELTMKNPVSLKPMEQSIGALINYLQECSYRRGVAIERLNQATLAPDNVSADAYNSIVGYYNLKIWDTSNLIHRRLCDMEEELDLCHKKLARKQKKQQKGKE